MGAERDALIALYRATHGDSWKIKKGWCTDAPLSEWYGVSVNEGCVVHLSLPLNNLQGEGIPSGNNTAPNVVKLVQRYNNCLKSCRRNYTAL